MRYPVLTKSRCVELAEQLLGGAEPAVDPYATWVGSGDDVDLSPISGVAAEIVESARNWADDADRDRLEGLTSPKLCAALSHLPPEILDDRGFWRYLSLRYFWEFIAWREEKAFARQNHLKYVDASSNAESVLPRMYLRAQSVGGLAYADLPGAIPKAVDFWRSHVIRVRTGSVPTVARAFVTTQREQRLSTNRVREAGKRLNRTWANVVLNVYDDDAAAELINEIWSRTE